MERTTAKRGKKASRRASKKASREAAQRPARRAKSRERRAVTGRAQRPSQRIPQAAARAAPGAALREEAPLTSEDRQVLTVLDDAPVEDYVHFVGRHVELSSENIRKSVEKLKREGLVEVLEDNDILRFFHTKKVTKDMIDEALDHALRYGPKEEKTANHA